MPLEIYEKQEERHFFCCRQKKWRIEEKPLSLLIHLYIVCEEKQVKWHKTGEKKYILSRRNKRIQMMKST